MSPTGSTVVAGVIGSPVAHSLSPVIHNAAFEALNLDWVYGAFDVPAGGGAEAVDAMRALGIGGLSVTMPLKQEVAKAVDRRTEAADRLNAVNCVAWDGEELVGHNTDGAGFVDALVDATGTGPDDMNCLILGAGGAARAVIVALASAGAAQVTVYNRTRTRAVDAALLIGSKGRAVDLDELATCASTADLVVNATSLGMQGVGENQRFPLEVELLRADQTVVDLVYYPLRTPLLVAAEAAGAQAVPGVGMLIHQAAHQLRLWTGRVAPIDVMTDAVTAALPR